ALGGINGHGMTEAKKDPAGLMVLQPTPLNICLPPVLHPDFQGILAVRDYLHDIAIVANGGPFSIDRP
ncbi:hypothetical protein, partial [Gluconobacter kondonii]|uniref:hypothetical protein n=1 Tax=Gluconobacter kondonii TaxID=941463 RepID=UPI0020136555